MNDDEEFEKYNKKIKQLYQRDPKGVNKALKDLTNRLNIVNELNKSEKIINNGIFKDLDKEKFIACIICILIALLGLINITASETVGQYYFGLVFFLAGFFIGAYVKGFGLIFLFSHGMTGLAMMVGFTITDILKSPLLKDGVNNNLYIYLGIALSIFVAATIATILRNLSNNFKEKQYSLLLPLVLYFIGILMICIFPKIYTFIYAL
jgi:hypothetical protein